MAVTAIWPIKGRVDKVINYARNPEKTTEAGLPELASLHTVNDLVEYAADEMKTECRSYVSCLNCREDTAAAQFMETKRLWGKLDGRVCYHGYQSFQADEVNAETAHEIGVKLAEELWGDRFEVVVATHCNTGHYHNHFVINSVSFMDGYKFYNSPADYAWMREVSDRLCREYAISVIQYPGRQTKNYAEWQAERSGRPTHRGSIRADIDRAIRAATTERDFLRVMGEMGYQIKVYGKDGKPLKYPALKPPGAKGYFRFHKLGEGYTLDEIRERILHNIHKKAPFPEPVHRQPQRYQVRGKSRKKVTGLRALYFRYCYELHMIVKRMLDNQYALLFIRGERPVRDFKYDVLKHPNIKRTTDGGAEPYRHGEDIHNIASIHFDMELLKQAVKKEGQDASKHHFILLTEEELEQKFIELEEQENAEQQKGE